MKNNLDIILNLYYKPTDELKKYIENNFNTDICTFIPVNGGASLKNNEWCQKHLKFDDSGINISHLNPWMNEMTSVYWYWNNMMSNDCEYIGFNHYRRFFNIDDIKDYENYDIIVSKPIFSGSRLNLATQYSIYHCVDDLIRCIQDIEQVKGIDISHDFLSYVKRETRNLAPCLMYIMKKNLFNEWCEFIFPILFALYNDICSKDDFKKRDNYQKRALCFLTERLFGYWYYTKTQLGLKTKEVDIIEKLDYKPPKVNERGDYS